MRTFKNQAPPWISKSLLWMIKKASAMLAFLLQSDAEISHNGRGICPGCVAAYLESRWPAGDRRPKRNGQWLPLALMALGVLNWADDSDWLGEAIEPVSQLPLN
jgi:hypothetical protein